MHERQVHIFEVIAADVRARVHDGRLRAGDRLPTSAELAVQWDVNVNTVLRALRVLAGEGVIDLRRGRGATVLAQPDQTELAARVDALLEEAGRLGLTPGQLVAFVMTRAGSPTTGPATSGPAHSLAQADHATTEASKVEQLEVESYASG